MMTGGAASPPPLPGRKMTRLPAASCSHCRPRSPANALSQSSTLQVERMGAISSSGRDAPASDGGKPAAPCLARSRSSSPALVVGGARDGGQRPKVAPQRLWLQPLQGGRQHARGRGGSGGGHGRVSAVSVVSAAASSGGGGEGCCGSLGWEHSCGADCVRGQAMGAEQARRRRQGERGQSQLEAAAGRGSG